MQRNELSNKPYPSSASGLSAKKRGMILVLGWTIGGTVVGAITSDCTWESLSFGDFGAGAWLGGILAFVMIGGTFAGMLHSAMALSNSDGCLVMFLRAVGGALLGGLGAVFILVLVVLSIRSLFENSPQDLKSSTGNALVVLTGIGLGAVGGVGLGKLHNAFQGLLESKSRMPPG
jgi:hypothetical protein